ncbi:MAG: hypothetical protein WA672_11635, partial [Candidatus Angelobacter sp.]
RSARMSEASARTDVLPAPIDPVMISKDSIFYVATLQTALHCIPRPKAFCACGSGLGAWSASPLMLHPRLLPKS